MFKNIFQTIKDWFANASKKSIDFLRPNATKAYWIVNAIKEMVNNPMIDLVTALTKTQLDNQLVDLARVHLPKIAEKLKVAEVILNSNPNNSEIIAALVDYLRKQNKDVRAAFYIALAGHINEALADGNISKSEAYTIGQIIFIELNGN